MINLTIDAIGNFCNHWPTLVVHHNQDLIFSGEIQEQQTVDLAIDPNDKDNQIQIGMTGKMFGANNIYDTKAIDGKILQDLSIDLKKVTLDNVDILDLLIRNDFQIKHTEGMANDHVRSMHCQGEICFNGHYFMTYRLPLYNYLINAKWKVPSKNVSRHSNTTTRFHYEEHTKELNEIEDLLNEIDTKFSDIRSKIRDS